jgi:hypothetical protein
MMVSSTGTVPTKIVGLNILLLLHESWNGWNLLTMKRTVNFRTILLMHNAANAQMMNDKTYKLRITVEDDVINATLIDSATTRDSIKMLPMPIELKDYAATEMIYDLPERLSWEGAPSGAAASVGDITYYAPWGNIALFYKDFAGLIKLGKVDNNIELLKKTGRIKARFEIVEK